MDHAATTLITHHGAGPGRPAKHHALLGKGLNLFQPGGPGRACAGLSVRGAMHPAGQAISESSAVPSPPWPLLSAYSWIAHFSPGVGVSTSRYLEFLEGSDSRKHHAPVHPPYSVVLIKKI